MAEITLREPHGPYSCTIDTGVMSVEINSAFLGISFVTEDGEKLAVSMRDSGFEIHYYSEDAEFDAGWTEFKNGLITTRGAKTSPFDKPGGSRPPRTILAWRRRRDG